MDKENTIQMFQESLTQEEKRLVAFLAFTATEGISINTVYQVLKPSSPNEFRLSVESLGRRNSFSLVHQTIKISPQMADLILKTAPIDQPTIEKVLWEIYPYIALGPLDDMLGKREYFVLARLFLEYLLSSRNKVAIKDTPFISLFADVVIAFASNVELSLFGNKRQAVCQLEDRLDFRLLTHLVEIVENNEQVGAAYRLLGELYANIFRYDEAKDCFQKAEEHLGEDALLMMAQAKMYENLGLTPQAFQLAYRAYQLNKTTGQNEANIDVCLYLSSLCAFCKANTDSKFWRNKACALIGSRAVPPCHILSIRMKEIEAQVHLENTVLAHQTADAVELEIQNLYGTDAPEMAHLSVIRYFIDIEAGRGRRSLVHYQNYVRINHANYGFSVGDLAVLYGGIIQENISRGNRETVNIYTIKMQSLYAEGAHIAPGVRFCQAVSNCLAYASEGVYELCEAYLDFAVEIYDKELMPDDALLEEIAPIFHSGRIPDAVLMREEYQLIHFLRINNCMAEGRIAEAKELIERLTLTEMDVLQRQKWAVQLGRVLIAEGKQEAGLRVWNKTLHKVDKVSKFEIAKEMAEWARVFHLNYDALHFYEEALQTETMAYGKTCDIVEALQCYADLLELCGLEEKSDESWKQALMLAQSAGDKDGIALLYYTWAATKEGHEAETLLEKAILHWTPDPSLFDETLSRMYHRLACAQAKQGKGKEAQDSCMRAIELYPAEFPEQCIDEISSNLGNIDSVNI